MKKSALVILVVLLSILSLSAQDASSELGLQQWCVEREGLPEATTPAFRQYQAPQISYATGSATVSIPLVSWNVGELPITLSLARDTRAIRKEAIAGPVGLGWDLQGLGAVRRSVRGFPDDWTGTHLYVREYTTQMHVDSLRQVLKNKLDPAYDRYTFDAGGYSGQFIVDGNNVVMLSYTPCTVTINRSYISPRSIDSFEISTPEGFRYRFAAKESSSYSYIPGIRVVPEYSRDYKATTAWLLTEIISPSTLDVVSISYVNCPDWTLSSNYNVYSTSIQWSSVSTTVNPPSTEKDYSQSKTVFSGLLPSKITSRTGTLTFAIKEGNANKVGIGPQNCLAGFTLTNPDGREVRKVEFTNSTNTDGRHILSSVTISSDGVVLDKYSFTYRVCRKIGKDFFGYANANTSSVSNYQSILLPDDLSLNPARKSDGYAALGALWTIEDYMGARTIFNYEPSIWTAPEGAPTGVLGSSIQIGIRLASIQTLDRISGREITRTFTYENPTLSNDLSNLRVNSLVSLSGNTRTPQKITEVTTHTQTATLCASTRMPGTSPEDTQIYYGAVTEEISGTEISVPIRKRYEYDLSNIVNEYEPKGSPTVSTQLVPVGNEHRPLASFHTYPAGNVPVYMQLFSDKLIHGAFAENTGTAPMLKSTTNYRYDSASASYKPLTVEKRFYTVMRHNKVFVGNTVETAVLRIIKDNPIIEDNISLMEHVSVSSNYVTSYRQFCDSVSTTTYFEDGKSRTTSTSYAWKTRGGNFLIPDFSLYLNGIPIEQPKHPGFDGDSILVGDYPNVPFSITVSDGNISVTRHDLISANVNSAFFKRTGASHYKRLPVATKWVVSDPITGRRDSIEKHIEYGVFTSGQSSYTRPTRTFTTYHGNTVDSRCVTAYDSGGNPGAYLDPDSVATLMRWNSRGELTSSSVQGTPLETLFEYISLVGVSSITSPSGRKSTYDYNGSYLSEQKNTAGETTASYSMTFYGDNSSKLNTIAVSTPTAGGTALTTAVYDAFGAQLRSVLHNASSEGHIISNATKYDAIGRPVRTLPTFPSASPFYELSSTAKAVSFYGDNAPWSMISYTSDGTSRKASVTAPSEILQDHPSTIVYTHNTATAGLYQCILYRFDGATLRHAGYWPEASLDVTETTDPDGRVSLTFSDWQGNVVLTRRVLDSSTVADTYTIADLWGNPLMIISPEGSTRLTRNGASWAVSDKTIADYAYIYTYDDHRRIKSMKLPGCEPSEYSYDRAGRAAFTSDGNLRAASRMRFTLYDKASRPVVTGTCAASSSLIATAAKRLMLATFDPNATGLGGTGYTTSIPLDDVTVLTADYYDDYRHLTLPAFNGISSRLGATSAVPSLLTGHLSAVVGNEGEGIRQYIASASAYDAEDRPVTTVTLHHKEGVVTVSTSTYAIDGNVVESSTKFTDGTSVHTLDYTYSYDTVGRPLNVRLSYDGQAWKDLQTDTYDAIGRVATHTVDDYPLVNTYNIHGLESLASPMFKQTIFRHDGSLPRYDGKISEIRDDFYTGLYYSEKFEYDKLSRLTAATIKRSGYNFSTTYQYDLNTNITSLSRYEMAYRSVKEVDILNYTLDGNRPVKIDEPKEDLGLTRANSYTFNDGADLDIEYTYDANGNMTSDANTGITSIEWSELNRVSEVHFSNNANISYHYSGDGNRLSERRKEIRYIENPTIPKYEPTVSLQGVGVGGSIALPQISSSTREWFGAFEYSDGMLDRISVPGGYLDPDGKMHIMVTDFQGNVRGILYKSDNYKPDGIKYPDGSGSGSNPGLGNNICGFVLEQFTDYYPYGLPLSTSNGIEANRRLFSGNELETFGAWNTYDFNARLQNPAFASFTSPDPLAGIVTTADDASFLLSASQGLKIDPSVSPYSYCAGDPVNLSDQSGLSPVYSLTGEFLGCTKEGFTGDVLVYQGTEKIDFSEMTAEEVVDRKDGSFDLLEYAWWDVTPDAFTKICTHIASQFEGSWIYDLKFSMETIKDSRIFYKASTEFPWATHPTENIIYGNMGFLSDRSYEPTVENIASSIIYHEWYGHIKKKVGDRYNSHRWAYKSVINSPLWKKTTGKYKNVMLTNLQRYTQKETKRTQVDKPYRRLYNKWVTNFKRKP